MGNKPQKIIVMKKFLLAVFMFLCITSMCCENNYKEEEKKIVMNGHWNTSNERSRNPIEATYNNSCLTINFNVSLGQTDIIIENEYGNMAYNSSTNVNEHDVLFIPIGNLPSGTYYITIICDGGSAEGEFRIENN